MLFMLSSRHVVLAHKLLRGFLLDDGLLDVVVGAQESVVNLRSRHMVAKSRIENVLRCWVLLDRLDVSGNGNVQV